MVIISELGLESDAYSNFINSINSEFTKKEYNKSFLYAILPKTKLPGHVTTTR
jgi:hypothetical protein